MDRARPTTTATIQTRTGKLTFEFFDNPLCLEVTRSIIEGKTYPQIPFITDVKVVVDIGANIGAAAFYFALQYPGAELYCFEPCPDTYRLLTRNLAPFPNTHTFECGLLDRDCRVPLYLSNHDSVTNSIGSSAYNSDRFVEINLNHARSFFHHQHVDHIDILKIDTEGCELPILQSLCDLLEKTRVIYLEYHDEADRLAIDALLQRTHILTHAKVHHPHRGELCYVGYPSFTPQMLEGWRIRRDNVDNAKARVVSKSPRPTPTNPV